MSGIVSLQVQHLALVEFPEVLMGPVRRFVCVPLDGMLSYSVNCTAQLRVICKLPDDVLRLGNSGLEAFKFFFFNWFVCFVLGVFVLVGVGLFYWVISFGFGLGFLINVENLRTKEELTKTLLGSYCMLGPTLLVETT